MRFQFYVLLGGFLAAMGAVAMAIWIYSADARGKIDQLAAANRDATQWALAQAEVELLAFKIALADARIATPEQRDNALNAVRQRFDIFFSRIATFRRGTVSEDLRNDSVTNDHIKQVESFLARTALTIDAGNDQLASALPALEAATAQIGPLMRTISLDGVRLLARSSDAQRERLSSALTDLALIVLILFAALVTAVVAMSVLFHASRLQTERIANARNRLQAVIGTSIDAIVVAGSNGRIIDFNGSASRIYGYSSQVAIGANLIDLLVPEDQRKRCRSLLRRLRTSPNDPIRLDPIEATARHSSGRVFPVEVAISSAMSQRGPVIVAFIRDISNRVAEQQELIRARDRAVAGERAKARMLAVMSHEMRTPLNGVLGTLELLKLTRLNKIQQHYLEVMEQSGRMLLGHVNDVLEVSRGEAGQISLANAPFDPAEIAQSVVGALEAQAGKRGNRLDVRFIGSPAGMLIGDQGRLTQILMNLVGNAVKFTESGTVTLEVVRGPAPGAVEFRVIDTGIGIPPEDRERIFEEFVTLDSGYSRPVEGTGLGLPIVRRLVKLMGGRIEVESTPGQGSVFRVILALPEARGTRIAPDRQRSPASVSADPSANSGEVLVVEDNAINRMIARDMLTRSGYTVVEAQDGREGVAVASQRRFLMILMDISMPRMDGIEATRAIRREGPNRDTPIIALTAHALPEDLARFDDAGMNATLTKPLSIERLREQLDTVLALSMPSVPVPQAEAHVAHPMPSQPVPPLPVQVLPAPEPGEARLEEARRNLTEAIGPEAAGIMAERALSELSNGLNELTALIEDHERHPELGALAHRMAGTAAVIGFTDVHARLAEIETTAKGSRPGPRDALALSDMIEATRHILAGTQPGLPDGARRAG